MNIVEVQLDVTSDELISAYGAGALVAIEFSATGGGAGFAVATTVPIVSGTENYSYAHAAGTGTTWYRLRYSNALATIFSDYSAEFQVGTTTYAALGDLLSLFETRPSSPDRLERLEGLLQTATDEFIRKCGGRDYFRHPASGTETWLAEAGGVSDSWSDVLHVHDGIVSLTGIDVSFDRGITFEALTVDQWILEGRTPHDSSPIPPGEPAFHLRLLYPFPTIRRFSPAQGTVRLTGARGWPAVPAQLREGIAQRARQMAYADPSFSGSVPGPSEYNGGGSTYERWPQILWRFFDDEAQRFWCSL